MSATSPAALADYVLSAEISATTADPDLANNNVTFNTRVVAGVADLSVDLTGPASVESGATATYLATAQNLGPSATSTVSLVFPIPAGATFVSASGTNWVCGGPLGNAVSCQYGAALASGATAEVVTLALVAPSEANAISVTVDVSSTPADPE